MKGHGLNLALALLFSLLIWWAIGSHLTEQEQVTIDFRIEVPKDVIARYEGQPSTANTLVLSQAVRVTIQGPKEQVERIGQLGLIGQLALTDDQLRVAFERDPPFVLVDPKKGVSLNANMVMDSIASDIEAASEHLCITAHVTALGLTTC